MTLKPNGPAPYTTAAAAITVIDAFRDRGLGSPVSADVLIRAGVPETLGNRTIQSLKQLGLLTEDGRPTDQFEDFRRIRGEEEYRTRLQEWLQGVYADVLQYADPSKDSYERVTEAFRTYEPAGQRRGMASLLLGLWKYSGLSVAGALVGGSGASPSPRKAVKSNQQKPATRMRSSSVTDTPAQVQVQVAGLPPALVGLLQQIPQGGQGWTEERRAAFLAAFTAVLNYTVPIESEVSVYVGDDQVDQEQAE
jgi:hypothetical protein